MLKLFPLFFSMLIPSAVWAGSPETGHFLFEIGSSSYANQVLYDVVIEKDGSIGSKPISAYWRHLPDGSGGPQKLTFFEKSFVYGVRYQKKSPGENLKFALKSFKEQEIELLRHQGKYVAIIKVHQRRFVLERIFVSTSGTGFIPKVIKVEIYGRQLKSGAKVYEVMRP